MGFSIGGVRSLSLTPLNPSIFPTNGTHSSVRQHKHRHKFSFRPCVRDSFHTVLHPYTKHKQSPVMTKKCHKPKLQANLPPFCYRCLLLLISCLLRWMGGRTEW